MTREYRFDSWDKFFAKAEETGAANTGILLGVKGPLTPKMLRTAIDVMQARYEVLRTHLVWRDDRYVLASGAPHIPLRVLSHEEAPNPISIIEQEMITPFEVRKGPLARFTLIEGEKGSNYCQILMCFEHAISDGVTLNRWVNDILPSCQTLARGEQIRASAPQGLVVLSEDSFPPQYRGFRGLARLIGYVLPLRARELFGGLSNLNNDKDTAPVEKRRMLLVSKELSKVTATILEKRCREEKTTVHGAFMAAMLMSSARMTGGSGRFYTHSLVDLRGKVEPKVGYDQSGCYLSVAGTFHRVSPDRTFWDLAREVSGELRRAVESGQVFLNPTAAVIKISRLKRDGKRVTSAITLSSSWKSSMEDFTPLELVDICPFSSLQCFGSSVMGVVAPLYGRLFWSTLSVAPQFSREEVESFATFSLQALHTALGSEIESAESELKLKPVRQPLDDRETASV
jgi:hypothetical protein